MPHLGHGDARFKQRFHLHSGTQQGHRTAIANCVGDLYGRQHDVEPIDDASSTKDAVIRDDPLPPVLGVERNSITRLYTSRTQRPSDPAAHLIKLGLGQRTSSRDQCDLVAVTLGGDRNDVGRACESQCAHVVAP